MALTIGFGLIPHRLHESERRWGIIIMRMLRNKE